ncbi:hydantoin racemase [Rhodophyticola sp. CCM32]|uniref:aspartate/glutamate racemase family protein n=1 Tax=Rhodophyticola sp. CCM32 TaxID=2916397 RepID=UPI00107F0936|nr:aspartate/glutamate racemase family protein [Rhodophyticola sp. CCM32]QBY00080.1 hydantoin racemase [Rhodophyticola sp. CCM32]
MDAGHGTRQVVVLNPNSSTDVTASMDACLAHQRTLTAHHITCHTLAGAPIGIETDADVNQVGPMVEGFVRATPADAYVIACFSDPGVAGLRRAGMPLVFGIAEAAYVGALLHGDRFGVISLGASSVARHRRMIEGFGLLSRLAGDRAVDMSVAEANDFDAAHAAIARTGAALIEDGAQVLILGCAGMGNQRAALQADLGCVVLDPVQAAVSAAVTALDMGYGAETLHV